MACRGHVRDRTLRAVQWTLSPRPKQLHRSWALVASLVTVGHERFELPTP